jgi:hypothetical protein
LSIASDWAPKFLSPIAISSIMFTAPTAAYNPILAPGDDMADSNSSAAALSLPFITPSSPAAYILARRASLIAARTSCFVLALPSSLVP